MSGSEGKGEVEIEATLEDDIAAVEHAVSNYLERQDDQRRAELLRALERLDAQTEQSDAWSAQLPTQIGGLGVPSHAVIGQTSRVPHAEEIPASELGAQVALVKAAKELIRHPDPQSVASLAAAHNELRSLRRHA